MSLLSYLRKTAQNAAIEGLQKIGVLQKANIPDDDDEPSKGILESYRNLLESNQAIPSVPVPEAFKSTLSTEGKQFYADNKEIKAAFEAWLDDRKVEFADVSKDDSITIDAMRSEMHKLFKKHGVIRSIPSEQSQWLETLQEIAKKQDRTVYNLLLQADAQTESATFNEWMEEMNEKIRRFGVLIQKVDDNDLTLTTP